MNTPRLGKQRSKDNHVGETDEGGQDTTLDIKADERERLSDVSEGAARHNQMAEERRRSLKRTNSGDMLSSLVVAVCFSFSVSNKFAYLDDLMRLIFINQIVHQYREEHESNL